MDENASVETVPQNADKNAANANKLLTAIEHIATGAENAAATAPSGSPHAMGWFARAKQLLAELRADLSPPPPPEKPAADPVVANPDGELQPASPADTSADAMNAGEAAANAEQQDVEHPPAA